MFVLDERPRLSNVKAPYRIPLEKLRMHSEERGTNTDDIYDCIGAPGREKQTTNDKHLGS